VRNAVARRQIEITREAFEGLSALWRDLAQPVSPRIASQKTPNTPSSMLEKV